MTRLDLGAGQRPKAGYQSVDLVPPADYVLDLLDGEWPWKDGSIDALHSSHFIEHIPADEIFLYKGLERGAFKDRLFFFFDEAYRILKPGGIFIVTWPALKSSDAFRDPTHRRFLPLEFTYYLSKLSREQMGVSHYNVNCNFLVVHSEVSASEGATPESLNLHWDVQKAFTVHLKKEPA